MKQIIIYFLTILTITSSCSSCKKNSDTPIAEIDKLPPITQTGANTFGCLINGVAFTPSTPKPLEKTTLKCYYDPTYGGGAINLSATNKLANSNSVSISINTFGINEVGLFPVGYFTAINVPKRVTIDYDNTVTQCSFTSYSLAPPPSLDTGLLEITKFDKTTSIISGKFQFTFYTTACDTIKITDGRFDIKYN